ncbi:transposase [Streptomyces sp. NPDC057654]|uniref:IS110 family transposase n=1 Tax=Streptomyces sp. NPDC057654 TaxID=3346196 RepID=UPI00369C2AFD
MMGRVPRRGVGGQLVGLFGVLGGAGRCRGVRGRSRSCCLRGGSGEGRRSIRRALHSFTGWPQPFVGLWHPGDTDCGRSHHHCLVLDAEGDTVLSRRVANDEPELPELIGDVLDIAGGDRVTWAEHINPDGAALRPSLPWDVGRDLRRHR